MIRKNLHNMIQFLIIQVFNSQYHNSYVIGLSDQHRTQEGQSVLRYINLRNASFNSYPGHPSWDTLGGSTEIYRCPFLYSTIYRMNLNKNVKYTNETTNRLYTLKAQKYISWSLDRGWGITCFVAKLNAGVVMISRLPSYVLLYLNDLY